MLSGRVSSLKGRVTSLNWLLIIFVVLTFAVLITGIVVMVRGGEVDKKYSNKLMQMRVIFQAIAIGVIMLAIYLAGK